MFIISLEDLEGFMFLGESMVFKENFFVFGKKFVWESLVFISLFWFV